MSGRSRVRQIEAGIDRCLVALDVRVELEPGPVDALCDVLHDPVMSERHPALVHRYPARREQVSRRLADTAPPERTFVGRRRAPLLQVGICRESVESGVEDKFHCSLF